MGELAQAPELRLDRCIDGAGRARESLTLAELGSGYRVLLGFRDDEEGHPPAGLDALQRLVELSTAHGVEVSFVAVDFTPAAASSASASDATWPSRLRELQERHGLAIPFARAEGEEAFGITSTPWFVIVDPSGRIALSAADLDPERALETLVGGVRPAPPPEDAPPSWRVALHRAHHGNVPPPRRVEKSDAAWRSELSEALYRIARQGGTERRFSSDRCSRVGPGSYSCACCGSPLFDASGRFDSRSGWPSFTRPVAPNAVAYHLDRSGGFSHVAVSCSACDAHLGHVFPDGPEPTGLRYCVNGLCLAEDEPARRDDDSKA